MWAKKIDQTNHKTSIVSEVNKNWRILSKKICISPNLFVLTDLHKEFFYIKNIRINFSLNRLKYYWHFSVIFNPSEAK